MIKRSISASQFFSLLYLSMLGSVFMYISSSDIKIASTDAILRPLVFIPVSLLCFIPSYICIKRARAFDSKLEASAGKSLFYRGVAVIYAIAYLLDGIMTAARFDLFASSELFPGTNMTVLIISLVVVCGALALLGIGAIARASTIFTVIVTLATAFAMMTLTKEVDALNFTPLFEDGIGSFIEEGIVFSLHSSVIGALLIFSSEIKAGILKHYVIWSVMSGISFAFILFFVVGTLGSFADTQLFPTYSAITLAEFGLLERLDALETAIWILCVVAKFTFYIIIIIKCIKFAFPALKTKSIAAVVLIIICSVLIFVSNDIRRFGFLSYMPLIAAVFIVPVLVLPVSLLIGSRMKRRDGDEESV